MRYNRFEDLPLRHFLAPFLCLFAFASLVPSLAQADGVRIALELKFDHAKLAQMAQDMTPPHPTRAKPYSADEIRQNTSTLSDFEYGLLKVTLRKLGFTIVHETTSRHYIVVQVNGIPGTVAQGLVKSGMSGAALNQTFRIHLLEELSKISPNLGSFITSILNTEYAPKLVSRTLVDRDGGGTQSGPDAPASPKEGIPASAVTTENDLPGVRPSTIRKWYGVDTLQPGGSSGYNLTGEGQEIAALAFERVMTERVDVYNKIAGVTGQPKIEVIGNNVVVQDAIGNETENELDLEMAGNIAPHAQLHSFVGGAEGTLVDWVEVIDQILDRDTIKLITSSYGFSLAQPNNNDVSCETQPGIPDFARFTDPLFDRAVAEGVTYLNATGDQGSDGCQNKTISVEWPSSDKVLQVGGTQALFGPHPDGSPNWQDLVEETGWIFSTGGVSILYKEPSWITGSAVAGMAANLPGRGVPDISWYADHKVGQPVYTVNIREDNPNPDAPKWLTVGGTSLAAPSMAGFLALVNEYRARQHKAPLLFVAPLLYGMSAAQYTSLIRDITDGNNGAFNDGPGWDMVTGLGSVRGQAMLNYLVGL